MSVSSPAPPEDTGRRYVPIRCVVEYVEPSSLDSSARGTHSRREQDTVVRLPGHCPFDDIVIVALQRLGYTTRDIAGAKGALQFPNWNSLSCDSITDNLDATVESILGGVSSLVTLRIRLHGRPRSVNREDVKEKLLSFLLQRLQPVLKNSGCPINQTILDEISNGDLIDILPSSTQQAFDRWFRDQMERQPPPLINSGSNPAPSPSPRGSNGFVNRLETNSSPSGGQRNGRTDPLRAETRPWSTVVEHPKLRLKDEPTGEDLDPKDDDGEDFRWGGSHGADSKPKCPVTELTDSFEKVPLGHRMRLLPNRNAVYETDALLPATPEPPEEEAEVLVVTPEMPLGEAEPDEPPSTFQTTSSSTFPAASSSSSFQNEPTDLSVRRMNGSGTPRGRSDRDGLGTVPGVMVAAPQPTEPPTNQSLMLRPLRVLTGQMGGAEYPTKDSRSPSPFLPPPFMHSAAAAAVSGLQNHLVHLQQQQQHAIQLAAMSRAFNFHFGQTGVHPLKGLTRDCDRPTFPYKTTATTAASAASLPCTPAPPSNALTHLGLSEKAMRDQKKRSRVFIDPLTEIPKLERWFSEDTHPSSYVIEKFTDELNRSPYRQRFPKLEPKNLQLWFKNHRAKMKRHRDILPSQHQQQQQQQQQQHQPPFVGQGFDTAAAAAIRTTPSPSSFYSDWADRSSTPGLLPKMAPGHVMMMTSSCTSPSSSTGSRVASSSPNRKSATESSDDEMDICPDDNNTQETDD